MMGLRERVAAGILLALLFFSAQSASSEGQAPALRIEPAEIQMGFSYSGVSVEITAMVPAGHEVAIVCAGEDGPVELKKRGKIWGVLWMNVGDLTFEQVPSLYNLTTSVELEDLAPATALERLGVGYDALRSRAVGTGGDAEREKLFLELIKLKEKEGLFSQNQGGVKVEPRAGDVKQITASCWFPTKTPPGKYEIRVYAFKNHEGSLIHSGALEARQVGVASAIVHLSRERGLLYGVVAVVIALAVGLLTGLVFGLGKKKTG